jgi:hypothetical protein
MCFNDLTGHGLCRVRPQADLQGVQVERNPQLTISPFYALQHNSILIVIGATPTNNIEGSPETSVYWNTKSFFVLVLVFNRSDPM